jgi:hypothetical protein
LYLVLLLGFTASSGNSQDQRIRVTAMESMACSVFQV